MSIRVFTQIKDALSIMMGYENVLYNVKRKETVSQLFETANTTAKQRERVGREGYLPNRWPWRPFLLILDILDD